MEAAGVILGAAALITAFSLVGLGVLVWLPGARQHLLLSPAIGLGVVAAVAGSAAWLGPARTWAGWVLAALLLAACTSILLAYLRRRPRIQISANSALAVFAAVAVPLMVGLGFPAMAAVVAGMIIQSTPVSFGAMGTPMLVGISTGLSADPTMASFAQAQGFGEWSHFVGEIAARVALIHAVTGTFIPLLVVATMTRFFGKNRSFYEGFAVWRFALFAPHGQHTAQEENAPRDWP